MSGMARGPIFLVAGGTGGHVFPALSLSDELSRRGHEVILITDPRGYSFWDRQSGEEQNSSSLKQVITLPLKRGRGKKGVLILGITLLMGVLKLGPLRP